jgi:hypothetical protein
MDLHIGCGLLIGFFTLDGTFLHEILPWSVGDLQIVWAIIHYGKVEIGCLFERKHCIGRGAFGILEEGVDP